MFFNTRSLLAAAALSFFALEASAATLRPISDISELYPPKNTNAKRAPQPEPMELVPIDDPSVLHKGRSMKREEPLDACFKAHKDRSFFYGAYAADNIYVANFTLSSRNENEYILPVENFAKSLKSIKCGTPGQPMLIEFKDEESFNYAQSAWVWVDKEDVNHFVLVTKPDQCYEGDNRSPYLVDKILFDKSKLLATVTAEEKPWSEIAESFTLTLNHEYVDPTTQNVTHPHLKRAEDNTLDISTTFNQQLFNFAKESGETAGLALSVDAEITTSGHLAPDFSIEMKPALGFLPVDIPKDVDIKLSPQDVTADLLLTVTADGTLGKPLDFALPEIEIGVGPLNLKGLLQVGPFVTMGVHFGSSALEGSGSMTIGTRAKLSNDALLEVKLLNPGENKFEGWTPEFEKIDPTFSAQVGGDVRAWAELAIVLKVEVFNAFGYQVGLDAQVPYVQASMKAMYDDLGVCGLQKTKGIEIDSDVGINVNLNAGKVNQAPDFQKDLFNTQWPIFTTCIGIGADDAKSTEVPEPEPEPEEPVETPVSDITEAPEPTVGPIMTGGTGFIGTGTAGGSGSSGFPMTAANTTFLKMARRHPTPTQLY